MAMHAVPYDHNLAHTILSYHACKLWRPNPGDRFDFICGKIWLLAENVANQLQVKTPPDILAGISLTETPRHDEDVDTEFFELKDEDALTWLDEPERMSSGDGPNAPSQSSPKQFYIGYEKKHKVNPQHEIYSNLSNLESPPDLIHKRTSRLTLVAPEEPVTAPVNLFLCVDNISRLVEQYLSGYRLYLTALRQQLSARVHLEVEEDGETSWKFEDQSLKVMRSSVLESPLPLINSHDEDIHEIALSLSGFELEGIWMPTNLMKQIVKSNCPKITQTKAPIQPPRKAKWRSLQRLDALSDPSRAFNLQKVHKHESIQALAPTSSDKPPAPLKDARLLNNYPFKIDNRRERNDGVRSPCSLNPYSPRLDKSPVQGIASSCMTKRIVDPVTAKNVVVPKVSISSYSSTVESDSRQSDGSKQQVSNSARSTSTVNSGSRKPPPMHQIKKINFIALKDNEAGSLSEISVLENQIPIADVGVNVNVDSSTSALSLPETSPIVDCSDVALLRSFNISQVSISKEPTLKLQSKLPECVEACGKRLKKALGDQEMAAAATPKDSTLIKRETIDKTNGSMAKVSEQNSGLDLSILSREDLTDQLSQILSGIPSNGDQSHNTELRHRNSLADTPGKTGEHSTVNSDVLSGDSSSFSSEPAETDYGLIEDVDDDVNDTWEELEDSAVTQELPSTIQTQLAKNTKAKPAADVSQNAVISLTQRPGTDEETFTKNARIKIEGQSKADLILRSKTNNDSSYEKSQSTAELGLQVNLESRVDPSREPRDVHLASGELNRSRGADSVTEKARSKSIAPKRPKRLANSKILEDSKRLLNQLIKDQVNEDSNDRLLRPQGCLAWMQQDKRKTDQRLKKLLVQRQIEDTDKKRKLKRPAASEAVPDFQKVPLKQSGKITSRHKSTAVTEGHPFYVDDLRNRLVVDLDGLADRSDRDSNVTSCAGQKQINPPTQRNVALMDSTSPLSIPSHMMGQLLPASQPSGTSTNYPPQLHIPAMNQRHRCPVPNRMMYNLPPPFHIRTTPDGCPVLHPNYYQHPPQYGCPQMLLYQNQTVNNQQWSMDRTGGVYPGFPVRPVQSSAGLQSGHMTNNGNHLPPNTK